MTTRIDLYLYISKFWPTKVAIKEDTAVSNGIWGQVCLSSYVFFLSILKDQISLLNGALYGSPKCFLWTFAKNIMTGSQLTKNWFFPKKMMFFEKISQKKYISWNIRQSTEEAHSKTSFRKDYNLLSIERKNKQELLCDKHQTSKK